MTSDRMRRGLDVHPSVVFHLGELLISDEVSALVELVKNAYDADAHWCRVTVDPDVVTTEADSFFPGNRGRIVIEDDGTGMDEQDIQRGWLTLAGSPKRAAKRAGRRTPRFNRTPLGDKGLGRLGVQRLGRVVDVYTTKTQVDIDASTGKLRESVADERLHAGIDWRDFEELRSLADVPVSWGVERNPRRRPGTRIVVTGLHNVDVWSGKAVIELQRKLSQFIFPFGEVRPFRVEARVGNEDLDLVEVSERVRQAATARFEFAYAGGNLDVTARYSLAELRPSTAAEQDEYLTLIERDHGRAFFEWLVARSDTRAMYTDGRWFLTMRTSVAVDDLSELPRVHGLPADPGPFQGAIDSFDFGRETIKGLPAGVLGLSEIVKRQSGVRVFRNGFAIRPYGIDQDDWLDLGSAWTQGTSWYGLKPRNVVGYVAISMEENAQLVEKTDREGLVDTAHSRVFFGLMREVVSAINRMNQGLHRGFNRYRTDHRARQAELPPGPEGVYQRMQQTGVEAHGIEAAAAQLAARVAQVQQETHDALQRSAGPLQERLNSALAPSVEALQAINEQARRLVEKAGDHARLATQLDAGVAVLEQELSLTREQMEQLTELAGLGLTSEALAHELRAVSGSLLARTRRLQIYLRQIGKPDPETLSYLEHVRSAVSTIRKQLSHVTPALRYMREETETFDIRQFLIDSERFHSSSLQRDGIRYSLQAEGRSFAVRMNRGRLTQVLDNLVINSRYWLSQSVQAGVVATPTIFVGMDAPAINVWDNGRGVARNIEDRLFEPFATNKPKGQGRGLGLFIARQLLASSGGTIDLLPDRNRFGNRYIFRIDLEGAVGDQD